MGTDSLIESGTGAALISHRPNIGTEAYACVIFPGISDETIARYEEVQRSSGRSIEIPEAYRSVLRRLNGADIFRLSLYGLPPAMCQDPPLLKRSVRQPLDLGSANLHWRRKYTADPGRFHIGSGPYSALTTSRTSWGAVALSPRCFQVVRNCGSGRQSRNSWPPSFRARNHNTENLRVGSPLPSTTPPGDEEVKRQDSHAADGDRTPFRIVNGGAAKWSAVNERAAFVR